MVNAVVQVPNALGGLSKLCRTSSSAQNHPLHMLSRITYGITVVSISLVHAPLQLQEVVHGYLAWQHLILIEHLIEV